MGALRAVAAASAASAVLHAAVSPPRARPAPAPAHDSFDDDEIPF
jgi:hypothetical protein